VSAEINGASPLNGDHLVDPVRELQTAILDMHSGLGMGQVSAIDVSDAGHEASGFPMNGTDDRDLDQIGRR
jgi:hypothetical protein